MAKEVKVGYKTIKDHEDRITALEEVTGISDNPVLHKEQLKKSAKKSKKKNK